MEHDPAPFDAPSPLVPSARTPALVGAGVLMLALPFAWSNPSFGLHERAWPWDAAARTTWHGDVLTLLWALTGLWCVVLGLTRAVRVRALGAAVLTSVLLLEVTRGVGQLGLERMDLAMLLPWVVLGGGLRVLVEPSGRRLGSAWAALGGLWALWLLATTFSGDSAAVVGLYEDARAFLADGSRDLAGDGTFWQTLLPTALGVLAAVLGLVAAAMGGRRLAYVAFGALFLAVAVPGLGAMVVMLPDATVARVLGFLHDWFIRDGLLVWWLAVFVLEDLGRARLRAGDGAPAERTGGGRLPLAVHLLALVGVAGLGLCLFNPEFGALARAWPHDVFAEARWTPHAARAGAIALLTLLLLGGLVWKPSRTRGWFLLLAVGATLLVFVPGDRMDLVPFRLPLAVAAVAAALLVPGARCQARGGLLVGVAVLAALLFMPWDVERIQATTPGPAGYQATALADLGAMADGADRASVPAPTPTPAGGPAHVEVEGRFGVILWLLPTVVGLLLLALGLLARVVPPVWSGVLAGFGLLLAVVGPGIALAVYTADPWLAVGEATWAEGLQTWARLAASTGGVWALALAVALMDRRRATL